MELLADPTVLSALKIVGAAIAIIMAIPLIVGAVIGVFIGRAV